MKVIRGDMAVIGHISTHPKKQDLFNALFKKNYKYLLQQPKQQKFVLVNLKFLLFSIIKMCSSTQKLISTPETEARIQYESGVLYGINSPPKIDNYSLSKYKNTTFSIDQTNDRLQARGYAYIISHQMPASNQKRGSVIKP